MTFSEISKYLLILLVLVVFLPAILIQLFRGILNLMIKLQGYNKVSASAVKKSKNAVKHVVVTGGSSGIGLELAREYLRKGHSVTIMARDSKKLEEANTELIQSLSAKVANVSDKLIAVSCDVSSGIESVSNALKASTKAFGDVDILVNCAGVTYIKDFVSADISEFERLIKINYLGCVYATKAVIASMKENRSGQIVFVSSQVAQVGPFLSMRHYLFIIYFCRLLFMDSPLILLPNGHYMAWQKLYRWKCVLTMSSYLYHVHRMLTLQCTKKK